MRKSREAAAESRERILETAARMFRARGILAVGIAEIMQEAGMTHGGFYKHFESKETLIAEACAKAFNQSGGGLRRAAESAKKGEELKAIVDTYLSERHRDNPGRGCALAALGGEVGNRKSPARRALQEGREHLTALVAKYWRGPNPEANASVIVSTMVGALIHARLTNAASSDAVLRDARRELDRRVGEQG